jgi:capsular polysaccharide biosynthesis protein
MSQQALDLRRSVQIVRRHKRLFGALVVLGLLIGAGYSVVKPPVLTSAALVLLPQSLAQSEQASSSGATSGLNIATQVVIASSDSVLANALPHVSPQMSLQALQSKIRVDNVAGSILSISATGATADEAETTANAVANSYIAYVTSPTSPVGQVSARTLESAASATGSKLPEQVVIYALLGVLGGALVGFVVSLAIGRNQRRLVERDAIASSIGAPVLASIPAGHPSNAASWAKLLEEYEPGVVHAWGLGKLLRQFGVDNGRANGVRGGGFSLTVLSLSFDAAALALGPQLAVFAASQGIPTALVIGPQQDENVTASLRIACSASPQSAVGGRKPLRLVVSDDASAPLSAAFVVVVRVVDGRAPQMPGAVRTTATVLGVSAGAATAEELARAATAADADGREIVGILVANPEKTDQTTGRLPWLGPPVRRQTPTRVNDIATEIKR